MFKYYVRTVTLILLVVLVAGCGRTEPTATPVPSTATSAPPTATPVPPTATPVPPTDTPVPPTATSIPPTDTPVPPTATAIPPSPTPSPSPVPPSPTAAPGYVSVFEPVPCRFYKPTGFDLECGNLVVPEDRSNPDGAQVRLHVAIFRSRSKDPRPDPLIYLTGGGGGNELDSTIRYLDDGNEAILDRRDFIMYNQRGAKYAEPYLPCEGYAAFIAELVPMNLPREEAEAKEIEFVLACRDSFLDRDIDLSMYNTAVNAADLNDLRIALGYDEINIYGTSYGTRLALEVLRGYGEHIRSAIIDSVYPPNVHFYSDYWINSWDTFKRIFDACEADPGCRERYPDIENALYRVLDDLHANPRSIKYSGSGAEITLTYDDAVFVDAMYLFPYLSEPGMVPFVIQSASQGDFSPIESLIPWAMAVVPSDSIADGVQYSILCREETPFDSYERLVELGNLMPPQIARGSVSSFNYDLCAEWGVDPADAAEKEPVVSDVPTLILSGEFDPITPPAWARLAAETLSNSYYYEFPGLGHGIMRSNRCGFRIGNQFLEDPYTEPDASCIDELPGLVFE
jgi:pimeloyl-ACP methyl ester carboxylesterase